MAYTVEIGPKADAQLDKLDATIGTTIESKIAWLPDNAAVMIHRRLVGMPDDLSGLCKLRVGHWRILYWRNLHRRGYGSIESRIALKCIAISEL